MDTKIEKISPERAQEYLTHNYSNRPIAKPEVRRYVRLYKSGKHELTHQGIAFDKKGRLRDGQTRLTAIVESGVTIPMMVTRGLSETAAAAVDSGRRRTDAQALSMTSGTNVSGFIAAIARELYAGGNHLGTDSKPTFPDRIELIEFYAKHADVIHQVWEAFRDNTAGAGNSYILAALVRATYHLPKKKVLRFAEVLASGYSKPGEEPIIQLRNHILVKRKQEKRTRKLRDELYAKVEQSVFNWSKGIMAPISKAKTELFPLPDDPTPSP